MKTLVGKPSPETASSKLEITGTYILDSRIFEYLDQIKAGRNGEYQLTDALSSYVRDYPIFASSFLGKRYDIGTMDQDFFGFCREGLSIFQRSAQEIREMTVTV